MKIKNKKLLIILVIVIIIIIFAIILFFHKNNKDEVIPHNENGISIIEYPDESYFVEENEKGGYKLKTDKIEVVGGLTFYDFKLKEYKNGFQKIELMVKNESNKTTKEKSFMIEPIDENGINDVIVDVTVKPLKPGESTMVSGHFAWDITGIVNYRVKEYLLND